MPAIFALAFAAAFATAAADTVSSEIGKAFGRRTFLITTLRPVPRGTDGAVSLEGTLAGVAALAPVAGLGRRGPGSLDRSALWILPVAAFVANYARERGRRDAREARPARQRSGELPQHAVSARCSRALLAAGAAPVEGERGESRLYNQLARPFTLLPPLLGIVSGAVCAFGSAHNPDPNRELTSSVISPSRSARSAPASSTPPRTRSTRSRSRDRPGQQAQPAAGHRRAVDARTPGASPSSPTSLAIVPTWLVVVYPLHDLGREAARAARSSTRPSSSTSPAWSSRSSTRCPGWAAPRRAACWRTSPSRSRAAVCSRSPAGRWWRTSATGSPGSSAAIFLLFLIGASSTKDFADIEGDRAGGCKTLPILHGPQEGGVDHRAVLRLPLAAPAAGRLPARPAEPRRTRSSPATRWPLSRARRRPHAVGRLHRLAAPARSRRADANREPPVLEAHVPDDDGGAGRLRGRRT